MLHNEANTSQGSQISYVGSPLLIPSWAIINVFSSLVFWIWIVAVACYYRNVWYTGYLPFQSSSGMQLAVCQSLFSILIICYSVYDNTGATYKASKVVSKATGYKLDIEKYKAYSPVRCAC